MYEYDFQLKYDDNKELSYNDYGDDYVELLLNGNFVGKLKVFIDGEEADNDGEIVTNREYIVINNEVTYLENITKHI